MTDYGGDRTILVRRVPRVSHSDLWQGQRAEPERGTHGHEGRRPGDHRVLRQRRRQGGQAEGQGVSEEGRRRPRDQAEAAGVCGLPQARIQSG